MRRVQRRGGRPTPLQHELIIRLLKAIDPRLEPLVDDIVDNADGAGGCVMIFMDLIGPRLAVGAVLVFKVLGVSPSHVALAWRLAEDKLNQTLEEGSALQVATRLLGVAAEDQTMRLPLLDAIFADLSFVDAE